MQDNAHWPWESYKCTTDYQMGGTTLEVTEEEKDLGVYITAMRFELATQKCWRRCDFQNRVVFN